MTRAGTNSDSVKLVRRRLISGGAWAFAGRMLTAITGLLLNVLIARVLPPAGVGAYFLLGSFVTVAVLIAQLGLQRAIVRLVAESVASGHPGRAHGVIIGVLRIGLVAAVVVAVLAWINRHLVGEELFHSQAIADVMWLGALWIVVRSLLALLAEGFRGFHDIRLATLFNGLASNSLLLILLFFCWIGLLPKTLSVVVLFVVIAAVISLAVAGWLMSRRLKRGVSREKVPARRLFEVGLPLLMSSLTLFLLTQGDLWIVGAFCPQSDVAIYGAAARLVQLVAMPIMIVSAVLPPIIADLYSRGELVRLEKVLRGTAALASIPAIAMLFVVVVAAPEILALVYGEFYKSAALPLIFLSLGHAVNVWAGSGMLVLMMTENQVALMKISVAFAVLLVLGDLFVVKTFGIDGVAAVSGAVGAAQALVMLVIVRRKTGVWAHSSFGSILEVAKQLKTGVSSG